MSETPPQLVVGTPCYGGQVTTAYFTSALRLQRACREKGIGLTFLLPGDDALIGRSRQDLVSRFMALSSATHLLFIDADIGFEPEQVFRLLRSGRDVAAAAYPLKRVDWEKAALLAREGRGDLESSSLSYVFKAALPPRVEDDFVKADYAGTGFLMVRREVFQSLAARYPQLRYERTGRPGDPLEGDAFRYAFFDCLLDGAAGYLPEDYSFCRRLGDMGVGIWVDLRSRLDHLGPAVFKGDLSKHPDVVSTPVPPPSDGGA